MRILTFPLPWWEGVRGRGNNILYLLMILAPQPYPSPHQGGGNRGFSFFKIFKKYKITQSEQKPAEEDRLPAAGGYG
jgi:hypothetical protein